METKHKKYDKYKPSGVEWLGDVPQNWEVKRLRFAVKTNPSKSEIRNLQLTQVVSFVPMEAVGEWGGLKLDDDKALDDVIKGYTYFRDGDVVVAKITPCFENGKGAIAAGLEKGVGFGTTELHVLRSRLGINKNFLFYLTISHAFRKLGAAEMYGAGGQKRVPEAFIKNLRHPLPPITKQQTIADFLDRRTGKIDELIAKKERVIELLREKRTALISHVVTKGLNPDAKMKDSGVEWLGEVPEHWKIAPLKFVIKARPGAIKTGPFGSQLLSSEMLSGTIKVYNQRSVLDQDIEAGENYISEEKYEELRAFTVYHNDILVTTRGTIGCCVIVPNGAEQGILHPCLMRIQADEQEVLTKYLSLLIQDGTIVQTQLRLMSNATTIEVIYSDSLKKVQLPLPPIEEQKQIFEYCFIETSKIDALIAKVTEAIEKLKEYRTALISAVVTGKIKGN